MRHHRRGLRRLLHDDDLLAEIEADWRTAALDSRRQTILRYVDKLTRTPAQMQRRDVETLREQGLADADILGVVECAAYYAYANRIVDGLGVELEPWFRD